ncbi:DinB family protein [Sphingobacterium shayense]|uniref:DinB family protein n=1 Tax=Sphingobacterium shayense TaxID=626343 RepID=UPI001557A733|nr:DinB family protein [Sphingobacterium shayense]NQD70867.1 DinB family protein [Sphingobacterium shayense]
MKTIKSYTAVLAITLGLLVSMSSQRVEAQIQTMSIHKDGDTADINSLLAYFEQTANNMRTELNGLSSEQLVFKPDTGSWSISQCVEHIILTDAMLFELVKSELSKPAQPEKAANIEVSDEQVKHFVADRSKKASAPKELTPVGKYTNSQSALKAFSNGRKPIIKYIKAANETDLRSHVSTFPTGMVDGYQSLLFIAAHATRHLEQIKEVKNDPNFPKN